MNNFKLVLIRHGYSLGNEKSLFSGWSDVPLTEKGRRELRYNSTHYDYPTTQKYYSSDLERCVETFKIIYENKAELDGLLKDFRELNFGVMENHYGTTDDFITYFKNWFSGKTVEGAESLDDFKTRVQKAIENLIDKSKKSGVNSVTVVTHSAFIRIAIISLTGGDFNVWKKLNIKNGLGYVFEFECSDKNKLKECYPIMRGNERS